ncbi:MAG TPA: prephenate dehydrogenase/arogenate dehydrogenase family protein [Blastocatellia bacterium]|nr:prephenate dehydrogenase/arogenate dehydrogenase family protein [Blastocatellia bacterium]
MFDHITIVGCGLLGGSFALALRRAGFTGRLTASGGSRGPKLAMERGIVDVIEESFVRGEVCEADLIYLAAPIGGIIDFLKTRGSLIKPGAVVTDAGSTKTEICRVARESLPAGVTFIGGHPMAGSEHTGLEYARADLFDRATWALVAESSTDQTGFAQLKSLIEMIGARVIVTEPEEHDAAVALISHLPQLVATTLATLLTEEKSDGLADVDLARKLAATGWRDMTRLAGSSWGVWRDIILTNQPQIVRALAEIIAGLQSLKDELEIRNFNHARELFGEANASVEAYRAQHYQRFENLNKS